MNQPRSVLFHLKTDIILENKSQLVGFWYEYKLKKSKKKTKDLWIGVYEILAPCECQARPTSNAESNLLNAI